MEGSSFSISQWEMWVHFVCVLLFAVNLIVRFAERPKLDAMVHLGTIIDVLTIGSFFI